MNINPTITVRLGKTRKSADVADSTEEQTPNYAKIAEEAASRLGKKLVIGACIVVATYVVLAVAGQVAVNTMDNAITD